MRSPSTTFRVVFAHLSVISLSLLALSCAGTGDNGEAIVGDGPYKATFDAARSQGAEGVRMVAPLLANPDGMAQRGAMRTVREIAYHSTRPGAEAERRDVSMTILTMVQRPSAISLEMRGLLLRMLAVTAADEDSLVALSALRGDEQLREDAEYAYQAATAKPAGVAAYPGRLRTVPDALLLSLAARESGDDKQALIADYRQLLDSSEAHMRAAALRALQRLGADGLYAPYLSCLSNADLSLRMIGVAGLAELQEAQTSSRLIADWEAASPTARVGILHALARRGDDDGRGLIQATAISGEMEMRLIALELLGAQEDPKALAILIDALAETDADVVAAAATALTSKARGELSKPKDKRDEAKARGWLHTVLQECKSDKELGAALAVLAGCANAESITLARPLMSRKKTAEAAATVCLEASGSLGDQAGAQALLLEILDHSRSRSTRKAVGKALVEQGVSLSERAARQGFITSWALLAGFAKPTKDDLGKHPFGSAGPDPSQDFVVEGKTRAWKQHVANDPDAMIDLTFLEPNSNTAVYAFAVVERAQAQEILCKSGSDDSIAIWVNGKLVHENNAARGVTVDDDSAPATLVAGANRILVKIGQGGGGFGFCLRLTDSKGTPLDLTSQ